MKKILLVVIMLITSVVGLSKTKITDKTLKGEYTRGTNTFTYIKDNLVFPNKVINTVKQPSRILYCVVKSLIWKY